MPKKMEDWIQESAIIAGFFMFGFGLYQIYKPAMWVVCGIMLMLFGLREAK